MLAIILIQSNICILRKEANTMQQAKIKKERRLKVYSCSTGGRNEEIPQIRIQGKWLADSGFTYGTQMKVTCDVGKLVLESMPKGN